MNAWEKAKGETSNLVKEIEKTIPGYDYSDKAKAIATDEMICEFFIKEIRTAKDKLFNIIGTLYELQLEKVMNGSFQNLKDELDVFSDEIKARYCEWKDIPKDWLRKIIRHDANLITGLQNLNKTLEDLFQSIMLELKKPKEEVMGDVKYLTRLKNEAKDIEKQIDNLVILFKEREIICNIKPASFEKTYQMLRAKIKKTV